MSEKEVNRKKVAIKLIISCILILFISIASLTISYTITNNDMISILAMTLTFIISIISYIALMPTIYKDYIEYFNNEMVRKREEYKEE